MKPYKIPEDISEDVFDGETLIFKRDKVWYNLRPELILKEILNALVHISQQLETIYMEIPSEN